MKERFVDEFSSEETFLYEFDGMEWIRLTDPKSEPDKEYFSPKGTFMNESDALELIDQMKTKLGIEASREEILADYNYVHVPAGGIFGPSIAEIKKKLGLKESEEEIENRMRKDESYRADITARYEDMLSKRERYIRRLWASGRLHTDKEGEFCPWLHAIASMYDHPDKICMSNSRCDQCHQPLITIWFRPSAYCLPAGFEGEVEICPSCMRQVSIDKRIIY